MDRLSAIETFVRVVDTGSFSAAARNQGIGQPAVSKAIAQLEEWLGVRLLLRSTRSLTPTEAGRDFYYHARRTIKEADEAVRAARGAAVGLSGRLRVVAPVCFSRMHLIPHLSRFLTIHPDLDIDLMLEEGNIDLVDEGIDIALRMGPLASSSMVARRIGQARRQVMASPAYFERQGWPSVPDDLRSHQAVIYTLDGSDGPRIFRKGDSEESVTLAGRVSISASEGVRTAVLAGLGFTVASEWLFTPELGSGSIVTALEDWSLEPIALSAIFPTGRLVSTKSRAFLAFVETCMHAEGAAMAA